MIRIKRTAVVMIALCSSALPLLSGCTPSTGFYEVEGTVTHNGEPVPKVFLIFHPANPDIHPEAMAMSDEQGRYKMMVGNSPGVPPGEHTVYATDPAAVQGGSSSDDPDYKEVITKYGPGTSTYKVTIDKDESELELKLD
ncbi:hypothetical protein FF011L_36970 [Roseimaritima multifibrata]|uniref:Carboxypeptidase regulatory-like domain-containing protein n=1 Tax=Roseimaritima multifibrata TaxID=1930274 RepID=A0A517MJ82_9BACT|nr:carboxypeptidase-like regulatory domain-containing protein [Roseimaritima multifibrata]QDS94914.1 hypothetical protein FF011L_36970 [Roseimaritima multifibrata]